MSKRLQGWRPVIIILLVAGACLAATTAWPKTTVVKASWYQCCNAKTASSFPFSANNPHIVAHKTLPFGTRLLLAYQGRRLCVVVRDRGPFVRGVTLDLTRAGAVHLGFKGRGKAQLQMTQTNCKL